MDRAALDDTSWSFSMAWRRDEAAAFVVATLPSDQADVVMLRVLAASASTKSPGCSGSARGP